MVIKVKKVSKKFKNNLILDDINIEFTDGKIYGLIGKNGSGKSVLLKMICGFYEPTKGEILFDEENIIKEKKFPPNTRSLIEKPNFIPYLTGFENLKVLANIQKIIDEKKIIETLKDVNLENDNKKYSEYSLGMKQKLGIAQVLMENPKVIILDEPFNGVDDETTLKIRNLLLKEKSNGKIIIIATHIKEDIEILADEVYKFNNTKLERVK